MKTILELLTFISEEAFLIYALVTMARINAYISDRWGDKQ